MNLYLDSISVTDNLIQDVKMFRLGKINVICGKNNSGKSTLLNAISKKKFFRGVLLNEDTIQQIISYMQSLNLGENIDYSTIQRVMLSKFDQLVYPFDFDFEAINSIIGVYSINQGVIESIIQQNFLSYTSGDDIPLIPPQRSVMLQVSVDGQAMSYDGLHYRTENVC